MPPEEWDRRGVVLVILLDPSEVARGVESARGVEGADVSSEGSAAWCRREHT